MSVILPNAQLRVERKTHQFARDEHGAPVASLTGVVTTGPFPGAVKDRPEQQAWLIRLDARHWPVEPSDVVTDGPRRWVVSDAQLHQHPAAADVDYIAVRATLDPPEVP